MKSRALIGCICPKVLLYRSHPGRRFPANVLAGFFLGLSVNSRLKLNEPTLSFFVVYQEEKSVVSKSNRLQNFKLLFNSSKPVLNLISVTNRNFTLNFTQTAAYYSSFHYHFKAECLRSFKAFTWLFLTIQELWLDMASHEPRKISVFHHHVFTQSLLSISLSFFRSVCLSLSGSLPLFCSVCLSGSLALLLTCSLYNKSSLRISRRFIQCYNWQTYIDKSVKSRRWVQRRTNYRLYPLYAPAVFCLRVICSRHISLVV